MKLFIAVIYTILYFLVSSFLLVITNDNFCKSFNIEEEK